MRETKPTDTSYIVAVDHGYYGIDNYLVIAQNPLRARLIIEAGLDVDREFVTVTGEFRDIVKQAEADGFTPLPGQSGWS